MNWPTPPGTNASTEVWETYDRLFNEAFRQYRKKQYNALPPQLQRLEDALKRQKYLLSVRYPWNHPNCRFEDSLTILGDGCPVIRFHVCTFNEGGRIKCLEKFPALSQILGGEHDLHAELMIFKAGRIYTLEDLRIALVKQVLHDHRKFSIPQEEWPKELVEQVQEEDLERIATLRFWE